MDATSLAGVAAKLQLWMSANVGDEFEPQLTGPAGSEQAGLLLIRLAADAAPQTRADRALLVYVAEVLAEYETHVHAIVRVPTPKEAAGIASAEIRKRAQEPPPDSAGAVVSLIDGVGLSKK